MEMIHKIHDGGKVLDFSEIPEEEKQKLAGKIAEQFFSGLGYRVKKVEKPDEEILF